VDKTASTPTADELLSTLGQQRACVYAIPKIKSVHAIDEDTAIKDRNLFRQHEEKIENGRAKETTHKTKSVRAIDEKEVLRVQMDEPEEHEQAHEQAQEQEQAPEQTHTLKPTLKQTDAHVHFQMTRHPSAASIPTSSIFTSSISTSTSTLNRCTIADIAATSTNNKNLETFQDGGGGFLRGGRQYMEAQSKQCENASLAPDTGASFAPGLRPGCGSEREKGGGIYFGSGAWCGWCDSAA